MLSLREIRTFDLTRIRETDDTPIWRAKILTSLATHLRIALKVNLMVVAPVTLLLSVVSSSTRLPQLAITVFVLTNTSFIALNAFYHAWWRPRYNQKANPWQLLLALLTVAALGFVAALAGLAILAALDIAAPASAQTITMASIIVSVVYGFAFFTSEDGRRHGRDTLLRLQQADDRQAESERARQNAERTALQALVNPHFVFNGLNSIAALIHEDPLRAEETTLRLARLMRHVLETRDQKTVRLDAEACIVRAYLEIEQVRMGDRLAFEVVIPENLLHIPIPPMLLQPLVENAVRHGAWQKSGGGHVRFEARWQGRRCELRISDNGPGFSRLKGTGSGMRLVRERLENVYGSEFEMQLERNHATGETTARVVIPVAP
jgi:sensor histidine kinase YesM